MPPPLWSYDKDVSVEGRRLELWVLITAAPTFKSGSWLCLGGGFWVSWLAGWGVWKSGFLFFFPFCFLVGWVCFALLAPPLFRKAIFVVNDSDDGSLSTPCTGCLKNCTQSDPLPVYSLRGTHTTVWLKGYAKFFF